MNTKKVRPPMLTYEEMQYFVAFAQDGTLTKVAEQFTISQPTITRAMKKAEETFGVPLFDRTKNSISLNECGKLAARELSILLKQTDDVLFRVRAYDKANRTIAIGSAAAVEIPGLIQALTRRFPEKSISTELKMPDELIQGLEQNTYQLIILPYVPESNSYSVRKIGEEHLMFLLPKSHKYAHRKSLSLAEMNGENLLLYSEIGFWADLVRKAMPDSRFLVQNERYSFSELIENSILPCFVTDLTNTQYKDRVAVPISDEAVNVTYYLVCKKSMRREYAAVFD
jgi:DNA-binding transcriptional LysR family regulator